MNRFSPTSSLPDVAGFLAVCSVVLAALNVCPKDVHSGQRPNVLMIAIDDLNNYALALGGDTQAKTPHLAELAERGTLFANAHCAAPACNPSRASVMTGVAPTRSGVYFNNQDWRNCTRLAEAVTLPQYFRDHGYKVMGGGKLYHAANLSRWGLEGYLDPRPWHSFFPSKSRQLADEYVAPGNAVNGSNQFYKGRLDWEALRIPDQQMGDAKVVAWAENQLAKTHDQPVFLAVGIYRPHIPWYTPSKWFDLYPRETLVVPPNPGQDLEDVPAAGQAMARRAWQEWMVDNDKWKDATQAYLASVSFADAMVGRLIDALDHGPNADSTVIVLWSDHGYHLGHKQHWEKFALWEQTTQVPLIVVDPRQDEQGLRCEHPVSLLDVYPTLVDLCGLPPIGEAEGRESDGRSLVRQLSGQGVDSRRAVVTTQGPGNHAVRSTRWRYIRYADGSEELYDHRRDPGERENVAGWAGNASVIKRLQTFLPLSEAPLDPKSGKPKDPGN